MEAAVQHGIDALASLEDRINRAVQVITDLRDENQQLHQQLTTTNEELTSTRAQLNELQATYADFHRENGVLEQKIKRLSEEVEELRGERKQVKSRIEKLLSQLDLLSAT